MTKFLKKLASRQGRVAIYALAVALTGVAVTTGLVAPESETLILDAVSRGIAIVAAVLALLNLTPEVDADEVAPS